MFVVAGAAVGAGVGTAFDEASRYLRYPETIAVPLVCQSVAPVPSALAAAPVGIAVRGLTESEAIAAGIAGRGAVIVTQMVTGGRAAQAGLRERDIIVRCNDTEVVDTAQLQAIVRGATPEQALRLRVIREGQALEIVLTKWAALP
jgi:S1-C subfamily serine protease